MTVLNCISLPNGLDFAEGYKNVDLTGISPPIEMRLRNWFNIGASNHIGTLG